MQMHLVCIRKLHTSSLSAVYLNNRNAEPKLSRFGTGHFPRRLTQKAMSAKWQD